MSILHAIGAALSLALAMFWQIFWGLSLGFAIAAAVETLVPKDRLAKWLPDGSARSMGLAGVLGMASSSCSYAAVAMTRTIVRKGADFSAAMGFQFAATNLVIELGLLMWVLMGWPFAAAEFVGGVLMITLIGRAYRYVLPASIEHEAIETAHGDARGKMEGHAAMAMAEHEGSWRQRLTSREGWTAIAHGYVMNWTMVWKDIAIGVLVAGALGAWVPDHVWQSLFLGGHGWSAALWSALIGPLIAMAAFTCSVGNVPLAVVLWNGGIGFGGVVAFIFGDLIIPPILNIYRKYYGTRPMLFLWVSFYLIMVIAALAVEGLFTLLGWVPARETVAAVSTHIRWNYTSVLDIVFGLLALALVVLFLRTGGPAMMRRMNAK